MHFVGSNSALVAPLKIGRWRVHRLRQCNNQAMCPPTALALERSEQVSPSKAGLRKFRDHDEAAQILKTNDAIARTTAADA